MIYLDYAATYPDIKYPLPAEAQSFPFIKNPNANYSYIERNMLQICEEEFKEILQVRTGHIFYFRCATESVLWLINKIKAAQDNIYIGHSPYEHDSCLYGVEMSVEEKDSIFYKNLDVYLHQWVNQITGEVFDLEKIKDALPNRCFLLVDMTAGFGKVQLPQNIDKFADAVFMSGHKIGAPYLSFCWVSDRLFKFLGGEIDIRNQYGLSRGTLSYRCIKALLTGCKKETSSQNIQYKQTKCEEAAKTLKKKLAQYDIGYEIICPNSKNFFIQALCIKDVDAEALQAWMDKKQIFIGVGGSACSATHDFRVLMNGYEIDKFKASSVIRISFGEKTTIDEIKIFTEALSKYIKIFVKE